MKRLWRKLTRRRIRPVAGAVERLPANALRKADVIITPNEVTDRHGTGVILDRIFGASPNILSIRTENFHHQHSFGVADICLSHHGLSRPESFARMLYALNGSTVQRVLCVPYHPDELISALALKELFGVPLCMYVMDDNNICSHGIPDELMREALSKSTLRLAISPEMRDEYEKKYSLKFWILPPVVRNKSVRTTPHVPAGDQVRSRAGILVGSLWSQQWLKQLRETVKEAGLQIHWYGNAQAAWLKVTPEELRQDGITDCGFVPEAELTRLVKDYPYAIVPSGNLDEKDKRPEIARLSLPTRMPYLLAASNTPMIVLGSPRTAAARFVERFGVGKVVPYDGARLRQVVEEVCQPDQQLEFRRRAAARSSLFSAKELDQWVWKSLEQGEACDERFEQAFRRSSGDIIAYLDPPAPKDLWGDFILVHQALRRLNRQGFSPDFVLDVGASSGVWSDVVKRIFPTARFILVEPLLSHYMKISDWYYKRNPEFECVPVAVSDRPGEADFSVSDDLYGSSLLRPADLRSYDTLKVPVRTVDQVAREKKLSGRGLLKIDVQFAEHLVLAGAKDLLPQVDALLVELSLVRYAPQALLFPEMCELIRKMGFRYYEDTGGWRCPVDGTMVQKDVLFVRENLFLYKTS